MKEREARSRERREVERGRVMGMRREQKGEWRMAKGR